MLQEETEVDKQKRKSFLPTFNHSDFQLSLNCPCRPTGRLLIDKTHWGINVMQQGVFTESQVGFCCLSSEKKTRRWFHL